MEEVYIWMLQQSSTNINKRVKVLLDRLAYYDPEEANLTYESLEPF